MFHVPEQGWHVGEGRVLHVVLGHGPNVVQAGQEVAVRNRPCSTAQKWTWTLGQEGVYFL